MRQPFRSIKRMVSRIASTSRAISFNARHYSVEYSFYSAVSQFLDFHRTPNKITYFVMHRRRCSIQKYLRKKYRRVIDKYRSAEEELRHSNESGRIWVFWWQGEHDAPPLVQKCIASIRRHSGSHDVVVLLKENYANYVVIPDYILAKHDTGSITHNQLANLLRVMLLAQCGGAWLDATIHVSGPIEEVIFRRHFYTHKVVHRSPGRFDHAKWSTYFLAGTKGNLLFRFVRDCYFLHWIEEDRQIDYFLFDYSIWLAYETVPAVRKMIDSVPYNNPCILSLQQVLGQKFDESLYQEYTRDTYLHKLTWKTAFNPVTEDNEETFYGYLLNNDGS